MTDATEQTATPAEFTQNQIAHANELTNLIIEADKQGSGALIAQASALHAIRDGDSWRAVTDPKTNEPFQSWTAYCEYAAPTKSAANISKGIKVMSLLGGNDPAALANAGIEKLYVVLGLIDKKIPGVSLTNAVDFAARHSAADLRKMGDGSSTSDTVNLVSFKVSKASHERFNGLLTMIGTALKIAGDGKDASDWQKVDALTEILSTLDRDWIVQTLKGEGDGGPRQATTFTTTPAPVILKWMVDQYVEAGQDADDILNAMSDTIKELTLEAENDKAARDMQAKVEAEEAKRAAKKTEANKNKLIRMSSNIIVDTEHGKYQVVDVFKDSNSAFVKLISHTGEGDQDINVNDAGGTVNLDDLSKLAVGMQAGPKPKKEAAPKEEPAKFSKQAQAAKGKGGKKAAAKKE